MREIDETDGVRQDFLRAAALVLVVAGGLIMLGAITFAFSYDHVSFPDRVELISGRTTILTGVLVLVAVIVLFLGTAESALRARSTLVAALLVGGVVVALSTFSIVDLLTRHAPSDDSSTSFFNQGSFGYRMGSVLPVAGSLLLALVAMVGANRLGKTQAARGPNE